MPFGFAFIEMDGHLGWEVVEEGYVYDEAKDDGLGGHRVDREDEYCSACGLSIFDEDNEFLQKMMVGG